MKINKAYKFRFDPTPEQAAQLAKEFGCARFVWNRALKFRKEVYAYGTDPEYAPPDADNEVVTEAMLHQLYYGKSVNYTELGKYFTELKRREGYLWLKEATAGVVQQKLIDLDKGYENFFKGRAKFPKYKKKGHAEAIRYTLNQRDIHSTYCAGDYIKLPKLGFVNIRWSQIPAGTPKMATVSKASSGKYFISFACEIDQQPLAKTGAVVGLDVGVKDVVVTSDGWHSGAPKFTYKFQRELKREQRKLSRKTKGSTRYRKQRIVVAKVHEKIANSRKDFLHKLTTKIVSENDVICVEDLNVSGMMKNRCLAKAVADVGIFELNRQLRYKAHWYGKEIVVIDRWFPSTKKCSACGQLRAMTLRDRTYECSCGFTLDRDENAAINILNEGLRLRA